MALKGPAALRCPAVQRTQNSKNHIYFIFNTSDPPTNTTPNKVLSSGCVQSHFKVIKTEVQSFCEMSGCRIIIYDKHITVLIGTATYHTCSLMSFI